jgi:membrane associated rhomboid family serine protease
LHVEAPDPEFGPTAGAQTALRPGDGITLAPEDWPKHPYGYLIGGAARASTRARLIALFARGSAPYRIRAVWTPETAGPVPPWDVPFLVAAYSRRVYVGVRIAAGIAGVGVILLGTVIALIAAQGERMPVVGLATLGVPFVAPLVIALGRVLTLRRSARLLMAEPEMHRELIAMARGPHARTAVALVVAWSVILAATLAVGTSVSVAAAGMLKTDAARPQLWRWLTARFVHYGVGDLLLDSSIVLAWGAWAEALCGRARVGIVLLAAMIGGGAASWGAWTTVPSVGALPPLIGLVGFVLVVGCRRRSHVPLGFATFALGSVATLLLCGLAFSRLLDFVANVGGLGTGCVLGTFLAPRDPGQESATAPLIRGLGVAAWSVIGAGAVAALCVVLA